MFWKEYTENLASKLRCAVTCKIDAGVQRLSPKKNSKISPIINFYINYKFK